MNIDIRREIWKIIDSNEPVTTDAAIQAIDNIFMEARDNRLGKFSMLGVLNDDDRLKLFDILGNSDDRPTKYQKTIEFLSRYINQDYTPRIFYDPKKSVNRFTVEEEN